MYIFIISALTLTTLFFSWCSDSAVSEKLEHKWDSVVRYPLAVNQFVSLPQDYSELINSVSAFTYVHNLFLPCTAQTLCLPFLLENMLLPSTIFYFI